VCVCVCVCVRWFAFVCVRASACVRTRACGRVLECVCTCVRERVRVRVCVLLALVHVCVCVCAQHELRVCRGYLIQLVHATAEIGHFSTRVGGGYGKVADVWQSVRRFVSESKWAKSQGLLRLVCVCICVCVCVCVCMCVLLTCGRVYANVSQSPRVRIFSGV